MAIAGWEGKTLKLPGWKGVGADPLESALEKCLQILRFDEFLMKNNK